MTRFAGAGRYKVASFFKPGIELVLGGVRAVLARKVPSVKTLAFRVITDESTRLAALKRGEVDIAYSFTGPLAEELRKTPGISLPNGHLPFTAAPPDRAVGPESPWADPRVRRAVSLVIDRPAINQSQYLGLARWSSSIVPESQEYFWPPPPMTYDPQARETAPGGGRIPERVRRRRGDRRHDLRHGHGRVSLLPADGGDQGPAPADGAGGLHRGLREHKLRGLIVAKQRRRRQRRHSPGNVRGVGGPVRLWQLPRYRRPLRRAGQRAESAGAQAAP